MSFVWSEKIDSILSVGFFLDSLGIRNWALRRDEALAAIDQLEALGVPILGGDVYQLVNELPEHTYDSWYCDRGADEADPTYLRRSADEARRYIQAYLVGQAVFSIVPSA